jgi:hypothetical protein
MHPLQCRRTLATRLTPREATVGDEGFGELVLDAHGRIERRHGLLVDHRDIGAAQLAQLVLGPPAELASLEQDVATRNAAVWAPGS